MPCSWVVVNGLPVIIRSSKRIHACCKCRGIASIQCDWKTGKASTCDRWLCETDATEVGPNKHLCPEHAAAWKKHPSHPDNALPRQNPKT